MIVAAGTVTLLPSNPVIPVFLNFTALLGRQGLRGPVRNVWGP